MTPSRSLAVLLIGLAACGSESRADDTGSSEPAAHAVSPEDRAAATERFENHCATCHGMDGKGHGPSATSLNPSPRDWTDADWQAAVTDEELRVVILQGGPGLGLSSLMPASRLSGKPGVVDSLVEIIRSFGR